MKTELHFNPDGSVQFLGEDSMGLRGRRTVTRFSRIVPVSLALRACFYLLRWLCGETGEVAQWTREWPCRWRASVIDTPLRFEHHDRQTCLEWEAAQFNRH